MFSAPTSKVWDHQIFFIMLHLESIASTSCTLTLWSFIIYITRWSIGEWKVKSITTTCFFFFFFQSKSLGLSPINDSPKAINQKFRKHKSSSIRAKSKLIETKLFQKVLFTNCHLHLRLIHGLKSHSHETFK